MQELAGLGKRSPQKKTQSKIAARSELSNVPVPDGVLTFFQVYLCCTYYNTIQFNLFNLTKIFQDYCRNYIEIKPKTVQHDIYNWPYDGMRLPTRFGQGHKRGMG